MSRPSITAPLVAVIIAVASVVVWSMSAFGPSPENMTASPVMAGPALIVTVDPDQPDSRSQVVVALSMAEQFAAQDIDIVFVAGPGTAFDDRTWSNLQHDWGLDRSDVDPAPLADVDAWRSRVPALANSLAVVIDESGTVVAHWDAYTPAQTIAPILTQQAEGETR